MRLRLITAALKKPSTIGVDMAHPVRMAATNDPYRTYQWALTMFGAETCGRSRPARVSSSPSSTPVSQATHPTSGVGCSAARDFIAPGTSANDENGHGTHVAGIIAATPTTRSASPDWRRTSRILPVRVLDADGDGDSAGCRPGHHLGRPARRQRHQPLARLDPQRQRDQGGGRLRTVPERRGRGGCRQ